MSGRDGSPRVLLNLDEIGGVELPAILVLDLDAIDEQMLPPSTVLERQNADRLYPKSSQRDAARRHRLRRQLLRLVAARHTGEAADALTIGVSALGAPLVFPFETGLQASLSHRGGMTAFGLHAGRIGVDIEPDRGIEPLPLDLLHQNERRALARIPAAERSHAFLRLWTLKEAGVKALQTGFRLAPHQFEMTAEGAEAIMTGPENGPPLRLFHQLVSPRSGPWFHLAIAVSGTR